MNIQVQLNPALPWNGTIAKKMDDLDDNDLERITKLTYVKENIHEDICLAALCVSVQATDNLESQSNSATQFLQI